MDIDKIVTDFVADFKLRYKGRRALKTAYHFFNWASCFDAVRCKQKMAEFDAYCRRRKVRATWRNAAEWYATGKVVVK